PGRSARTPGRSSGGADVDALARRGSRLRQRDGQHAALERGLRFVGIDARRERDRAEERAVRLLAAIVVAIALFLLLATFAGDRSACEAVEASPPVPLAGILEGRTRPCLPSRRVRDSTRRMKPGATRTPHGAARLAS